MGLPRDPVLANQIILGIAKDLWTDDANQAVTAVGGVPMPVMSCKPAHRQLIHICGFISTGAVPASKQLYTVPAGKVLRLHNINMQADSSAYNIVRDGTADAGNIVALVQLTAPLNLNCHPDYAIRVTSGLRCDAADQTANKYYYYNFWGYLEDEETSEPVAYSLVS